MDKVSTGPTTEPDLNSQHVYNFQHVLVLKESIPPKVLEDLADELGGFPEYVLDNKYLHNTPKLKAMMLRHQEQGDKEEPKPLLILLDFRTFCYPINTSIMKWAHSYVANQTEPPLDLYHAYYLKWLYVLTLIPKELRDFASKMQETDKPLYRVVIVDDYPERSPAFEDPDKAIYWRHYYEPRYKAGRADKPDTWQTITSSGYEAASKLGLPIVKEPFMEADDLIAQYVRDREKYNLSGVAIWTVDTDLLQLVTSDEPIPVVWYNKPYAPYFRDEQTAIAYWLKRWKHRITKPHEIAQYKAENGDSSDNLKPGTDIGLIDLINPKMLPTSEHRGALSWPMFDQSERDRLHRQVLAEMLINNLSVA